MFNRDIITLDEKIKLKRGRAARRKAMIENCDYGRFGQKVERNKKRYTRKTKHKR